MSLILLYRIIGVLEGISYILLLILGMPLKYIYSNDIFVKLMGMPHGILFVLFIIITFFVGEKYKQKNAFYIKAFLASILPFGTFIFDLKILSTIK